MHARASVRLRRQTNEDDDGAMKYRTICCVRVCVRHLEGERGRGGGVG